MASLVADNSPIASRTRKCLELFARLIAIPRQPEQQAAQDLPTAQVVDSLGRFKIWAGNIGALQNLESKSSLDYRLRDAPKISIQIVDILDDLAESVEDASSIVSSERENRTGSAPGCDPDDQAPNENDSLTLSDEEEVSEIKEIFESITDAINSLFRLSMIIRNNTSRDRYAKAAAAALSAPFNDQFDIDHVKHKFPTLKSKGKEWLALRLGKAITQRRQYLRYCREHHDKISRNPETVVRTEVPSSAMPMHEIPKGPATDAQSAITKPLSTLAPTQASTLLLTAGDIPPEEPQEDIQSQTSYATSHEEDSSRSTLHVTKLEDVSKGLGHFECPYCWQIQACKSQKSWKKHVFSDLKPYLCTYQDCELKLFPDQNTWFSHELKDHRKEWRCHFCHSPFVSPTEYQKHLKQQHPQSFVHDQISVLMEISQKPIVKVSPAECPFCDDWEKRLRAMNKHISPSETIVVTPSQFKHHVGSHMEQLALFAIPRGNTEEGEADSGNAAPEADSSIHSHSLATSLPESRSGVDFRACEDLLFEASETKILKAYFEAPLQHCRPTLSDMKQALESGEYKDVPAFIKDFENLLTHLSNDIRQLPNHFAFNFGNNITAAEYEALALAPVYYLKTKLDEIRAGRANIESDSSMSQEEQWKRWRAQSIPVELTSSDTGPGFLILFTLPNGEVLRGRFGENALLDDLRAFVECRDYISNDTHQTSRPDGYKHQYKFSLVPRGPSSQFTAINDSDWALSLASKISSWIGPEDLLWFEYQAHPEFAFPIESVHSDAVLQGPERTTNDTLEQLPPDTREPGSPTSQRAQSVENPSSSSNTNQALASLMPQPTSTGFVESESKLGSSYAQPSAPNTFQSAEEQWKHWRAARIPATRRLSSLYGESYISVRFKLVDGRIFEGYFTYNARQDDLFAFVDCYELIDQASLLSATEPNDYEHEYDFSLTQQGNQSKLSKNNADRPLTAIFGEGTLTFEVVPRRRDSLKDQVDQLLADLAKCSQLCKVIKMRKLHISAFESFHILESKLEDSALSISDEYYLCVTSFGHQFEQGNDVSREILNRLIREVSLHVLPYLDAIVNEGNEYQSTQTGVVFTDLSKRVDNFQEDFLHALITLRKKYEQNKQVQNLESEGDKLISKSTIAVTIIYATGLTKYESSEPDSFVRIKIDGQPWQSTSVQRNTVDPYWNETFHFDISAHDFLTIEVFDLNRQEEDNGFLGWLQFLFDDPTTSDNVNGTFILSKSERHKNIFVSGNLRIKTNLNSRTSRNIFRSRFPAPRIETSSFPDAEDEFISDTEGVYRAKVQKARLRNSSRERRRRLSEGQITDSRDDDNEEHLIDKERSQAGMQNSKSPSTENQNILSRALGSLKSRFSSTASRRITQPRPQEVGRRDSSSSSIAQDISLPLLGSISKNDLPYQESSRSFAPERPFMSLEEAQDSKQRPSDPDYEHARGNLTEDEESQLEGEEIQTETNGDEDIVDPANAEGAARGEQTAETRVIDPVTSIIRSNPYDIMDFDIDPENLAKLSEGNREQNRQQILDEIQDFVMTGEEYIDVVSREYKEGIIQHQGQDSPRSKGGKQQPQSSSANIREPGTANVSASMPPPSAREDVENPIKKQQTRIAGSPVLPLNPDRPPAPQIIDEEDGTHELRGTNPGDLDQVPIMMETPGVNEDTQAGSQAKREMSKGNQSTDSEYPRKGKTRIPARMVNKTAIVDLGYHFEEEGAIIVILKALSRENIDELLKLSDDYKASINRSNSTSPVPDVVPRSLPRSITPKRKGDDVPRWAKEEEDAEGRAGEDEHQTRDFFPGLPKETHNLNKHFEQMSRRFEDERAQERASKGKQPDLMPAGPRRTRSYSMEQEDEALVTAAYQETDQPVRHRRGRIVINENRRIRTSSVDEREDILDEYDASPPRYPRRHRTERPIIVDELPRLRTPPLDRGREKVVIVDGKPYIHISRVHQRGERPMIVDAPPRQRTPRMYRPVLDERDDPVVGTERRASSLLGSPEGRNILDRTQDAAGTVSDRDQSQDDRTKLEQGIADEQEQRNMEILGRTGKDVIPEEASKDEEGVVPGSAHSRHQRRRSR